MKAGELIKLNDPRRAELLAEARGEPAPAKAPHDYKADLLEHLAAARIPVEAEVYWAKPERKFRADWRITNTNILIEYEGGIFMKGKAGHSSVAGILRDIDKGNVAAILGYAIIRVTPNHIKSGQALRWIEEAFALSVLGPRKPIASKRVSKSYRRSRSRRS